MNTFEQDIRISFELDAISNTELYKIALMSGIALHPQNRDLMQAYINNVIDFALESETYNSYVGVKKLLWGQADKFAELRKQAAEKAGITQDFSHMEMFEKLTCGLIDVGKFVFWGYFDAFLAAMNDNLLLNAAMAMPGATDLRTHYLGTDKLDEVGLLNRFKQDVFDYVKQFNDEYVDIEDFFVRLERYKKETA